MRYPIMIEEGTQDQAYGVAVPDLPGCFSAGDTLDEAMDAAKEAVAAWVDTALDAGQAIPEPSSLETVRQMPEYQGWTVGVIEVDPTVFDDTIERVNVTLPRRVLRRLDELAASRQQSRGAFISSLTMLAQRDPVKIAFRKA